MNTSDDKTSGAANWASQKNKLFEEFETMSQLLQEEKNNFEEEMTRRKKELESEVEVNFAELAAGKEELEKAKSQLEKKREDYTKELEKKKQSLKLMKEELEQGKKAYLNQINEEQGKVKAKEAIMLKQLEARSQELQKGNDELAAQKVSLENELKNLRETLKKEEDVHFQKLASLKGKLEALEDEIEQNLFWTPDPTNSDYTKNSRELIINTVTGDTYRGNINIASKKRLSDMFTRGKSPFVIMYDVIFKGVAKTTVIINKHNIVSVRPLDNHADNFSSDDKE